jgi:hypothetical protein
LPTLVKVSSGASSAGVGKGVRVGGTEVAVGSGVSVGKGICVRVGVGAAVAMGTGVGVGSALQETTKSTTANKKMTTSSLQLRIHNSIYAIDFTRQRLQNIISEKREIANGTWRFHVLPRIIALSTPM